MKTLLIILFPFLLSAQTDVIITSTLWSAISGRTEYHRMEDRRLAIEGNEDYLRHSKIWHTLEVPEVLSAFSVGGVIALDSLGLDPFAQPYIDFSGKNKVTKEQKNFARWVNHKAIFRSVKWENYI